LGKTTGSQAKERDKKRRNPCNPCRKNDCGNRRENDTENEGVSDSQMMMQAKMGEIYH
jgi:hypothetical protein